MNYLIPLEANITEQVEVETQNENLSISENVERAIYFAHQKVGYVQNIISRKSASPELRKLFAPISTYLTAQQLKIDDQYFLKALVKLELISVILFEKSFRAESAEISQACHSLRQAYVSHLAHNAVGSNGNKISLEFSHSDLPRGLMDESTQRRIMAHFLAVGLCGVNYLRDGLSAGEGERFTSTGKLEDHGKYLRNAYYRLFRTKQGFEKIAKLEQSSSDPLWKTLMVLMPSSMPPIFLDFKNSTDAPKSGLVGINAFALDLASLLIISENLRTHGSGSFTVLSEVFGNLLKNLFTMIYSYFDKIGGSELTPGVYLSGSRTLKIQFLTSFKEELRSQYRRVSKNSEFKAQSEGMYSEITHFAEALAA